MGPRGGPCQVTNLADASHVGALEKELVRVENALWHVLCKPVHRRAHQFLPRRALDTSELLDRQHIWLMLLQHLADQTCSFEDDRLQALALEVSIDEAHVPTHAR